MDDLLSSMEQDAADRVGLPIPQDSDFQSIAELVNEQLRLEEAIEDAEKKLKELKEQHRAIERGKLPAAVERFGFSSFKMKGDLIQIDVKDEVYAGITDEKRDAAFEWLFRTGHDDIIKNSVSLSFGKGQDSETKQLLGLLNDRGYSYTNNWSVHPSTLKAFVKQQLEVGASIPMDTFSIHVEKVAKIKFKK